MRAIASQNNRRCDDKQHRPHHPKSTGRILCVDEQEREPEVPHTELPEPPEWEWKRQPPPVESRRPDSEGPAYSRGMGLAMAIGFAFVGPVLGGVLIGALIDRGFGGTWSIVGLLVGTVVAFATLIRLVNKLNDAQK